MVRFHLIVFSKGIYHSEDPKITLLKIAKKEKVQRGKNQLKKILHLFHLWRWVPKIANIIMFDDCESFRMVH